MKIATEKEIVASLAAALILMFCAGLLAALGTMDWRWLALSALAFVILVGNART